MSLFNIFINIIESFIICCFIHKILSKRKIVSLFIVTSLYFLNMTIYNFYVLPDLYFFLSSFFILYFYAFYLNRNQIIQNSFLSLYAICLNTIAVTLSISITYVLFGFPFYEGPAYIFITCISKVIFALFSYISLIYIIKYSLLKTKKLNHILVCLCSLNIVYSLITEFIHESTILNISQLLILFFVNVLSISLAIVFIEAQKEQQEHLSLQEDKFRLETQYQINQINKTNIDEMKKWKHDMKDVLHSIAFSIKENDLNTASKTLAKSIMILDNNSLYTPTTNSSLDYVIAQRINMIKSEHIHFVCNYTDTDIPLEQTDFFIILGNLLDNAIENCQSHTQKQIILSIGNKNNYFYMKIENTVTSPILINNPDLFTTKEDAPSHGYGIKNVKLILSSYQGILNFESPDHMFIAKIIIPLNTKQ